jgi:hypothetical protein
MRDHQRDQRQDFRAGAPAQHPLADPPRGTDPGAGQIVMGPSFYVWDESPREAREWGVELANAWLMRRR